MILNNLITSMLVKDYDEAISFYSGKLGFVVVEDVPMGADRWVTIAVPGSHETVFALHVAKSDSDLALVGKQGGSFPFLGITTDDCLRDFQRLKALGVKFQGEPEVRPYGTGVMLEDLYGNKIFLNQESANEAAKTASS
jgi:catechol 2,3-dioxygenase-like lactoylglutathione lyase family enzyme